MTDLFNKRTDKQLVIDWVFSRRYTKTSDVILEAARRGWPVNRVVRNVQDFAQRNPDKIRRMSDDEVIRYFGNIKEGVWEIL